MFSRKRALFAAAAVAAAGGLVALRVYDPATSGVFPPCPVWYLTGWYCPGCGSLRAMHQLLHGNLQAAWAMNPLAILFFPFIGYGLVSHAFLVWRGRGLPGIFLPAVWIRVMCGVIVLFGVLRNLPVHPFNMLAPGGMLRF